MCGVAGFLAAPSGSLEHLEAQVVRMANAIQHRGPDDSGAWVDAQAGIALGHRRLSIVDLSSAGHQPMPSAGGRFVIAFNGEIYNHLALRAELQAAGAAPAWRGHSDTETLLAGFEHWGVRATLVKTAGMFAIALWDTRERTLYLARDRLGEKPLYYGWQSGVLLFGSELKALTAHPAFERRINRDAVALLLRHNHIPSPWSIWQGIAKLPAGTLLTLPSGSRTGTPQAFWSLTQVAEYGQSQPLIASDAEAITALEGVLGDAVAGQMMADVPLGALLSGGIDSSTIVALMQARSSRPVKTFSIGFHEKQYDESAHARLVAQHLKTDHTALFMTAGDVLNAVPRMPTLYDEPFADSSQLPTALVMALARPHVKVALSGDGGDEFFGGYNRYQLAPKVWRLFSLLPQPLRAWLGRRLLSVPASTWDTLAQPLARFIQQANLGDKAHKLGLRLLSVRSLDDLYVALVTEWTDAEMVVLHASSAATPLSDRTTWPQLNDPVHRMMALDGLTYLPDDILVKVDRAAMAVSLETRATFLDHRVVEFAWRLPMHQKIRNGQSKWLLRQLLYRHVPRALLERPKMGFGIPLDAWLRGPLRDWAESLLARDVLSKSGYFDADAVRSVWQQHLSGQRSYGYRLWSVLMFQAWLEENS